MIRSLHAITRPQSSRLVVRLGGPKKRSIPAARHNNIGRRRWLSTSSSSQTPPLAVRTALVATTTALATPACPPIFVVNAGLRYVVWDSQTRHAVLGATTLVGGVYTLVHFAAFDLLPVAYSYGQLFLPFALVNGTLAGTAYLGMDLALGTARVASTPWTGAAMGAFVGLVGPMSGLYDLSFQYFYDIPEASGWFDYLLNNRVVLPLSMATGTAVGTMLHPLLYFPIVGVKGVHWAKFSAPLLAAAGIVCATLYTGDYYNLHPETYLTQEEAQGKNLVTRFHPKHLQLEDWSFHTGYRPLGTGIEARESVTAKLAATHRGNDRQTDLVFDSRRKAWLHYVTNGWFGEEFAVPPPPSHDEVLQQSQEYLYGDGATAFVLNGESQSARESLLEWTSDLHSARRSYTYTRNSRQRVKATVDRIELASHGIALLLSSKKIPMEQQPKLEQQIRQLLPGIVLYKTEETEETQKGCSVESQLETFGWKGMRDEYATARAWKMGWHQYRAAQKTQSNKQQLTWAATGLSVVLLYLVAAQ